MAITLNTVYTQVQNSPLAAGVGVAVGFIACYWLVARKYKKKANSGPMGNI